MTIHTPIKGFSLVELMIGLFVGLFVIGGSISYYAASVGNSADILGLGRLHQDLAAVSQILAGDLRRAGYWNRSQTTLEPTENPFMADPYLLAISADQKCITYAYDRTNNGVVNDDELFGISWDSTNKTIRMLNSGIAGADCTGGRWEAVTDPNVMLITNFKADFAGSRCVNTDITPTATLATAAANATTLPCDSAAAQPTGDKIIESQQVNFTITAQLVDDSAVTLTLSQSVAVNNQRLYLAP